MGDSIAINVHRSVYEKLQRLAVLTGDVSSAIERLIAHWEVGLVGAVSHGVVSVASTALWHSPSGDALPVGETLQCTDGGNVHHATVEHGGIRFKGSLYDSPSAAARAVKETRGLKGASASTNGREFWKFRDPKSNRWIPISALRPPHRVSGDALLNQLLNAK
jgi:hypothetical protein